MEKHAQIPSNKICSQCQPSEQIYRIQSEVNEKLPIDHQKKIAQYLREQKAKRTRYSMESQIEIPPSVIQYKIEHNTKEFEELKIREIFTHMQISPNESYSELLKKAIKSRNIITTQQQISNSMLKKKIYQHKLKMSKQKQLSKST
jgi:hypothetical protein